MYLTNRIIIIIYSLTFSKLTHTNKYRTKKKKKIIHTYTRSKKNCNENNIEHFIAYERHRRKNKNKIREFFSFSSDGLLIISFLVVIISSILDSPLGITRLARSLSTKKRGVV